MDLDADLIADADLFDDVGLGVGIAFVCAAAVGDDGGVELLFEVAAEAAGCGVLTPWRA